MFNNQFMLYFNGYKSNIFYLSANFIYEMKPMNSMTSLTLTPLDKSLKL